MFGLGIDQCPVLDCCDHIMGGGDVEMFADVIVIAGLVGVDQIDLGVEGVVSCLFV